MRLFLEFKDGGHCTMVLWQSFNSQEAMGIFLDFYTQRPQMLAHRDPFSNYNIPYVCTGPGGPMIIWISYPH